MTNASSRRSPLPLCLLALLGLMASCVYHRDHGEWCEGTYHDCGDSTDCHEGQFCGQGTCHDAPPGSQACATSSQCGWRETCVDGHCTQQCTRNADCPSGATCKSGFCSAPQVQDAGSWSKPDAGTSKPDAGSWTKPDAGTPKPDAGTSTPDAGCSCQPPPPPPTCRLNSDCGAGNYCINATCYEGCDTDSDCRATEACSMGVCRPRPSPACSTNTDCPTGNDCVDGTCRAHCTSDAQCQAPNVCHIGYCMPPPSPTGSGQVCQANCDCPSGERCLEGRCRL
jgi:Cys-rich repeat protein